PQVLAPQPRETAMSRMHHDEPTLAATDGWVPLFVPRFRETSYHTALCGSDRAAHSGIASSRRGLRSSLEVWLTMLPAVAYHHRSVAIRSASVQGTLVPRASMRAGDIHRTAAKVSWGLHAGEDAALESIEDGDAPGERPTGMREGR